MADQLQLRSLNADPKRIFSVGSGAREGMVIPQDPPTYKNPAGYDVRRSPRILEISKDRSYIYKKDLINAPKQVKNQLALLIERSEIEVYDITGAAALTGDQVRAL